MPYKKEKQNKVNRDKYKNHTTKVYLKNCTHHWRNKKVFCRHSLSGSMTVEAAWAVPLLFFAWLAFISLTASVKIYETVQHVLSDQAVKMAVTAEENKPLTEILWKPEILLRLRHLEDVTGNGWCRISNMDFSGSQILESDEWIDLKVRYSVELMEGLIPLPRMRMQNRVRIRAWTGWVPGQEDFLGSFVEDSVYVTDYGRVYHKNRMCSHIKLQIYMTDKKEAEKYPPCERCVGNEQWQGDTFYVTQTGEKYHSRLGCSGLKRQVQRITGMEAVDQGYIPCQRCGGE